MRHFSVASSWIFWIGFLLAGTANPVLAQSKQDLSLNPTIVFQPDFSASSCHWGDYFLGDDVFNVVYDPIVSTSFAYRQLPLSEQIREVEIQGGVFWMEDGSGLFIRNGRITEFRFDASKLAQLEWTPTMLLEKLGPASEKRPERMLEDGPIDSYLLFYAPLRLRFRVDTNETTLMELAIGCSPEDPVWD